MKFTLRCYIQKQDNHWEAFCLDFSLAAHGNSPNEARDNLTEQIKEYIFDALAGRDKEHAHYLLTRRAPIKYWVSYYFHVGKNKLLMIVSKLIDSKKLESSCTYRALIPMKPA